MTTWTNASEDGEYVVEGYVVSDYVLFTYEIADGSGTVWTNATEAVPSWTNQ